MWLLGWVSSLFICKRSSFEDLTRYRLLTYGVCWPVGVFEMSWLMVFFSMENWIMEIFESKYYSCLDSDCGVRWSDCDCTEHSSKICGFVNIAIYWTIDVDWWNSRLICWHLIRLKVYMIECANKLAMNGTYVHILLI